MRIPCATHQPMYFSTGTVGFLLLDLRKCIYSRLCYLHGSGSLQIFEEKIVLPEIKLAIEKGELIILFGAGASCSSFDGNGRPILLGSELAKLLAQEASMEYQGEALPIVYSSAKKKLGDRIYKILEDRYRHCRPSNAYQTISKYPWPRIYTLNIDDAFESALRNNSKQKPNIRYRYDRVADRDQLYDKLDFVKLNGSADKLDEGLIFSPQEYGAASAKPPLWYRELAQDFFRFTFLFIGTRLSEPLFFHQIERYRQASQAKEGRSYVLTQEATEIERGSLEDLNLQHISGTLEQFATWLEATFPNVPTPLDVATSVHPQLRFVITKKDPDKYVELFQKIMRIGRKELASFSSKAESSHAIRDFYRGFKPNWGDILEGVPARLRTIEVVQPRLLDIKENEKLFVIYGSAGSGKTTALMQLAMSLSEQSPLPVYFLSEPIDNIREVLEALEESHESRYYFFIDRLSTVADGVHDGLLSERIRRGIIVATERQNVWNSKTSLRFSEWCAQSFQLKQINEADAKRILEKLEAFGPWHRLSKLKPQLRVEELVNKAHRQLLIGLLESTSGNGFEKIIENDYNALTNDNERKLVVLVGLATIHRLNMAISLASRALQNLGVVEGITKLLKNTSGIVHYSDDALTVRHPVYVESLFELAVAKEEKAAAIHALLEAFTVYKRPLMTSVNRTSGMLFKLTVNHGFLKNTLQNDRGLILGVYTSFVKAFQDDALFWLQYGLALRDAGEQDEALEKLRTACDTTPYPLRHAEHAYAQQLLILAQSKPGKAVAYSYVDEAREILNKLDEAYREGESDYPMVTLSEIHTKVVTKFEGTEKGRGLAKDYANLLHDRMKTSGNARLQQAWKSLTTFSTTGKWPTE